MEELKSRIEFISIINSSSIEENSTFCYKKRSLATRFAACPGEAEFYMGAYGITQ